MSTQQPFRSVTPATPAPAEADDPSPLPASQEESWLAPDEPEYEESFAEPRSRAWALPAFLGALAVGWTALFVVANADTIAMADAARMVALVGEYVLPLCLLALVYLLVLRSSTREANRFGAVARSLADEATYLESRLGTINRELSLAREFLATQSRELEYLGRSASDRLGAQADRLQALVRDNGAQIDAIAQVSTAALDNMDRLRSDLPVIATAARDVSNQIGGAGRIAIAQVEQLSQGFVRLNEFGQASERQAAELHLRMGETLAAFSQQTEHLGQQTEARLATLRASIDELRAELHAQESDALEGLRTRSAQVADEFAAMSAWVIETQDRASADLADRLETNRANLTEIDAAIAAANAAAEERHAEQIANLRSGIEDVLATLSNEEAVAFARTEERLRALDALRRAGEAEAEASEAAAAEALAERAQALHLQQVEAAARLSERMAAIDADLQVRREHEIAQTIMLTEHGEAISKRMEELAGQVDRVVLRSRQAQDSLVAHIHALGERSGESEALYARTSETLGGLIDNANKLLEVLRVSKEEAGPELCEKLSHRKEQVTQLADLGERLHAVLHDSGAQADAVAARLDDGARSMEELSARLAALNDNAEGALGKYDQQAEAVIARLREEAPAVMAEAVGDEVRNALEELSETTQRIARAGRTQAASLHEQLERLSELASNLEARVERAREQATDELDSDFSRRVALITEALNSTAIDVDAVLATEVSETAWTAYLRGDRGIFTRRAVRLLEQRDQREVAQLYESDPAFRDHVNRYIHDFEFMLRTMLSTRNGNALGVTILSSDMGKLYVALAQAIERLRQ